MNPGRQFRRLDKDGQEVVQGKSGPIIKGRAPFSGHPGDSEEMALLTNGVPQHGRQLPGIDDGRTWNECSHRSVSGEPPSPVERETGPSGADGNVRKRPGGSCDRPHRPLRPRRAPCSDSGLLRFPPRMGHCPIPCATTSAGSPTGVRRQPDRRSRNEGCFGQTRDFLGAQAIRPW